MFSIPKIKRAVDLIVYHCSATRPSQNIGAETIDRWHRERGFLGCGYHIVIKRDGTIEDHRNSKARPYETVGAHVGDCGTGYNKRSIGVCLIGGVSENNVRVAEDNFTVEQMKSMLVVEAALRTAIDGNPESLGHRDLIKRTGAPAKACPCFEVKGFLSKSETGAEENFPTNPIPSNPLAIRKHTVKSGDTLWRISNTYGVPVAKIRELNRLTGDLIRVNQTLKLY